MQDDINSAVADTLENGAEAINSPAGDADGNTLTIECDRLAKQTVELQEQLLRNRAEFENYRKRRDREQLEFAEYAGMEMMRALLPILDDFERATKAANDAGSSDELTKGVELIYNRMLDTLRKQGLEPIASTGQKFDPNLHHAIKMVQNEELDDHTVLQEYQRGYNFKGRPLRPAMVEVSIHP